MGKSYDELRREYNKMERDLEFKDPTKKITRRISAYAALIQEYKKHGLSFNIKLFIIILLT